ncbi:single-stranded-DNA-specific exonuclease RecJ [Patescibacteria group bacterium]|nr:MAG: single-stranded-DNA-specific exonuclease RecJ [Patescibacteria group bacterium]
MVLDGFYFFHRGLDGFWFGSIGYRLAPMMKKKWIVAKPVSEETRAKFPDFPPVVLQLLFNRGLKTEDAIQEFLYPDYETRVHDPLFFREMKKAVERISQAIGAGDKIIIHGDYDADGVAAAALLATTLAALGANYEVFLPHREEDGYGLNLKNVERFAAEGAKVIITCDCGIANTAEIAAAEARGTNVIITDHHALPAELPSAFATIHPGVPGETYPWQGLAGGGVAFKLAQALIKETKTKFSAGFDKWLLDFVAISSVADMVPLLGETRTLVKYGLIVLSKTRRPGLRALLEAAGVLSGPISANIISFQIAPRVNAAGRLNHASAAFALLMEQDPGRAAELAKGLDETNRERQRLVEAALAEARRAILDNGWQNDSAIVVAGDWAPGIVGLIAGKLMDEYWRPVFAVSLRDRCLGSGRSIPEYHLVEAMRSFAEMFEKFGGHPQACGFTVKEGMVEELRARLRAHSRELIGAEVLSPTLAIDAEITLRAVDWDFYNSFRQFEPFGVGNPEPKFLARGLMIRETARVGVAGKHLRLTVSDSGGEKYKMIAFGFGVVEISVGDTIDAVFTVGENQWNGNRELQLKVIDLKKADSE